MSSGDGQRAIADILDRMWGMDRGDDVEEAERRIAAVDAGQPGALWAVATTHPHVETRAVAARLCVARLLGDRPLVAAGVRAALEDADEDAAGG